MASEKERIINMLEEGKITADDAAKLLAAIGEPEPKKPAEERKPLNPDLKGRKLRVIVDVDGEDNVKVNVALPLALAKIADSIITNVIPKEASKELEAQGINLAAINLSEIVDNLTDLDEDIVNVDIDGDETVKVRVYVE
jgi:hypothetical protein